MDNSKKSDIIKDVKIGLSCHLMHSPIACEQCPYNKYKTWEECRTDLFSETMEVVGFAQDIIQSWEDSDA